MVLLLFLPRTGTDDSGRNTLERSAAKRTQHHLSSLVLGWHDIQHLSVVFDLGIHEISYLSEGLIIHKVIPGIKRLAPKCAFYVVYMECQLIHKPLVQLLGNGAISKHDTA